MSVNNINNAQIQPEEVPLKAEEQPVDENQVAQFEDLTKEEKQKKIEEDNTRLKIKENNTRFIFDQMMSSLRRYTQEMQQQIKKQQEEEES